MHKSLAAIALVLAAIAPVAAEESQTPAGHKETLEAWQWLETTRGVQRAMRAHLKTLRDAGMHKKDQAGYRTFARELYRLGSSLVKPAEETFRAAFGTSDWAAWDVKEHEALVAQGLDLTARHQIEHDPGKAVATLDHLVKVLPDHALAKRATRTWLPIALPATGDLALAKARLAAMAEAADAKDAPNLIMTLGDVHAMEGAYDEAQAQYEAASQRILGLPEEDQKRHKRTTGYLKMRMTLIGRPAPTLGKTTFVGGEACTLASLKDKVVLLDFWATWCGPCLKGIPGIQGMHESRGAKGLAVLGVTRMYEKRGVLPEKKADERGPALLKELYKGEGMEAYLAHLDAFRGRMPVTYPFVVAEADVLEKDYLVTGIPTMVVIDPGGNVGFLAVGGMKEKLLEIAVDRRLKALGKASAD